MFDIDFPHEVIKEFLSIAEEQAKKWKKQMTIGIAIQSFGNSAVLVQKFNDQGLEQVPSWNKNTVLNELSMSFCFSHDPGKMVYCGRTALLRHSSADISVAALVICQDRKKDDDYSRSIVEAIMKSYFLDIKTISN